MDAVSTVSRKHREKRNPFEVYSEVEFRSRYRFYKDTVRAIIAMIEDKISPMTSQHSTLTAGDQLLITLRFYATGMNSVGDDQYY